MYVYLVCVDMCYHFKYRQQISTSVSSDTESVKQRHSSGLLPKLAISAEGDSEELLCSVGSHKVQEKTVFVNEETVQDEVEVEVTTPASTISNSTLSGMIHIEMAFLRSTY